MRNFLSRFIGRPHVAAIINFGNICCLAAFLLFLVASRAEALPQNTSFIKSSNSPPSSLAGPSPSCFSRPTCIGDANFQQEFRNFVNFIHTRYPSAQVPSAERLQRHACRMLSSGGSQNADNLEVGPMGQWLATFLSYSFWSTQSGTNPYPTSPVWWCFLDNSSRYVVTDTTEAVGATNIINTFNGLGKPAASGGAGFYVSQAIVTDAYPAISLDPGFFAAQTYTNKELVAIDLAAPGTTKRLAQYQSLMKIQTHATYPRRTISFIQETVNTLKTVEWLGLCSFACTNCAPGTVCPLS